jgi:hypothetical protein
MTFKPATPGSESARKSIPLKGEVILSNFVPLMLSRMVEAGKETSFSAVVEDARDGKFDTRKGTATVFGVNKKIQGLSCRRSVVEFGGVEGEWWVTKEGKLCELRMPASGSRLARTTESEAKKALAPTQ